VPGAFLITAIVHVDIPLSNQGSGANFYRDTFDWNIDSSMPAYPMFSAEGGPGGGFPQKRNGEMQMPVVRVYVGVSNIEDALRKVEANGARPLRLG
jgi:predicted enzyme related to lactoylglutathione lyase